MEDIKTNETQTGEKAQSSGQTCGAGPQPCGSQSRRCGSGKSASGVPTNPLEALHQMWNEFSGGQQPSGHRAHSSSANNKVDNGSKKFTIKLDVEHYEPNEIEVKIVGKDIVITAEHEERTDRLGRVSRRVQRKFELPEDVEAETIVSTMTPQGVLIIEGLKKKTTNGSSEVVIPVLREGDNKPEEQTYENDQQMDWKTLKC